MGKPAVQLAGADLPTHIMFNMGAKDIRPAGLKGDQRLGPKPPTGIERAKLA
jgi:hypothetical protein